MISLMKLRKDKGMTQAQLAAAVKHADPTADQVMISVLERGQLYPTRKLLKALCEALGCEPTDIYEELELNFIPALSPEYSESTKTLATYLKEGAEHAVSRQELGILTGWGDRHMREKIALARQEGLCIANEQRGGGYYIPVTRREIEQQIQTNRSRALAILKQQTNLKEKLDGCED